MAWTRELKKTQKRELRRIAALAYERELATALTSLEAQFVRWRSGEIGPFELNETIHAFHQGPNRELWSRYANGALELEAFYAVRRGIVLEAEVEPDTLAILRSHLEASE